MGRTSVAWTGAVAAALGAFLVMGACDKGEEGPPDCGPLQTLQCDPNCASAQPPQNCATAGSDCGRCDIVGYTCTWLEADVTCECDHRWHCSNNLSCSQPDGGYACN
jgi:hypothetical protein